MMDPVALSATTFAEYAAANRRRRAEIVTTRHAWEVEETAGARFYQPIVDAIRVAAESEDPAAVLAGAVAAAELTGQPRAFAEVADGFAAWWPRARAQALPIGTAALRLGGLEVTVTPHLVLRTRRGDHHLVLFHLKEDPLTRDTANAALRVLQLCTPDLLPDATPLVVDLRRAREFRLSRTLNTAGLDAWLTAQAAAYTTHWHATA